MEVSIISARGPVVVLAMILWCCSMTLGFGQNLAPNHSFETMDTTCASNQAFLLEGVSEWYDTEQVSSFMPNYYSSCTGTPWPNYGVPNNFYGHQQAYDGNAYIGASLYQINIFGTDSFETKHSGYTCTKLTQPLVAGQEYCINLWANRSDSSQIALGSYHAFLFNDSVVVDQNNSDTLWATTQPFVIFDISAVDTTSWTLIEGSFIANGGEQHLALGKLYHDQPLDTSWMGPPTSNGQVGFAHYLFDNVSLIACPVGVEERGGGAELHLFPNPTDDVLHVMMAEGYGKVELQISDVWGQIVQASRSNNGRSIQLDVSSLAPGPYQVRIKGDPMTATTFVVR